jgi:hypothetical protein
MLPYVFAGLVASVPERCPYGSTLLITFLLGGCIQVATPQHDVVEALTFGVPVVVDGGGTDRARAIKEPSLEFLADGTILICGPRTLGSGSDLWRSEDGERFEYVGSALSGQGPPLRSGSGDLGGGDCDLAGDAGGMGYLVDTWFGGLSVSATADGGATWRGVPASIAAPALDRPWAAGRAAGELFVLAASFAGNSSEPLGLFLPAMAGGLIVARSTDGGLTFPQQVVAVENHRRYAIHGNLVDSGNSLYFLHMDRPNSDTLALHVARSDDAGLTWHHHKVAEMANPVDACPPMQYFPIVAAARGGQEVYVTWNQVEIDSQVPSLYFASSADRGVTWNPPLRVTDRGGTFVMPWVAAGEGGRVALAWYESSSALVRSFSDDPLGDAQFACRFEGGEDAEWHLRYAFSVDGTSPTARFEEALPHGTPVHVGLPTGAFAEFFQLEFDPQGRAAIAYVADVAGEARPFFVRQVSGPLGWD